MILRMGEGRGAETIRPWVRAAACSSPVRVCARPRGRALAALCFTGALLCVAAVAGLAAPGASGASQAATPTQAPVSASGPAAGQPAQGTPTPAEEPAPQPDKRRARQAFEAGRKAEQAGDWKAEFAAYSDAALYDPSNREYAMLKEHARFQVVQSLVDAAERQAVSGNIPQARTLLEQALDVDPKYAVARERLAELTPSAGETERQNGPRLAGLPHLAVKPGTHSFDYRGTTRGAYEAVGAQFGVKMAFDGDLADRPIRFQVPSVDFDTAIEVLSLEAKTFTRVVDEHTMFVTQNTAQKEKDYAPEVEKEIVLPASVANDEMNETVRTVREMTGITRTQLNTATRTLTVRSTEQNVALAEAIVNQIEQPRGEVMLDIDILELDRTLASDLGISPPTSSNLFMLTLPEVQQLQAAQNNGTLIQILQTIFGSSAVSSATGSALPALIAFGGGKTIFLASMPSVTANFSTTLSTVQSAQRVLLRAEDGKPAIFFVGDRYPIDLGLLSSNVGSTASALSPSSLASALSSGLTLPRTDYDVGAGPISVAIADFNKDGFPDLAVANQTDGTISILEGSQTGTFTVPTGACKAEPQPFPGCISLPGTTSTATSPSAIVTGDFNDDGNIDLAVTDMANSRVLILLGNGDGTFQAPVAYPTGSNPVALVAQDFDGDGQPDLAVVNQGDGKTASTVSVLLGNLVNGTQNGTFATKVDYPVGVSPSAITAGVFVTNGFPSLAVTNKADNTVSILLGEQTNNVANGLFTPSTPATFDTGNGPAGVATADFNSDGKPDLAITNETDGTVSILLGNGDGTFQTQTTYTAGSGPTGIVAADFAGSFPDLAVTDMSGNNVDVLVGNGDGTFNSPISLPTGNDPIALADADLNGDGTLDLVTANNSANTVTVTLNTLSSNAGLPSSQIGYPGAEYEDLGVKIKATPRLHDNNEVTLQLQFDIKNLSGDSINGIPILSNRNIEQTIRLRENETSVLSGLIQTNELKSETGWPWTSTEPGIGYLTGEDTANIQKTELLILVTPRALRYGPRQFPALYAGRGEPSTPPSPEAPPPGAPVPGGIPPQGGAPGANQPPQGPPGAQGGRGPFGPAFQPGQGPGQQPQQQVPPANPNPNPQQPPQELPPQQQ